MQRRAGIRYVAEQIREGQRGEGGVGKGQRVGRSLDEGDARWKSASCLGEHLRALVEADNGAACSREKLASDCAGTRGDVEHRVPRTRLDARDEEPAPARVLAE